MHLPSSQRLRALHVAVTGVYSGSTAGRVRTFQRAHHLGANGAMNAATWLALLKVTH